jgi:NAD(P)-dependent dehydrogenase (short-subunit alcohol dehydrogenase family)
MKQFKDRVAVVTGAASGMGRQFILDFARRGMHVVLADLDEDAMAAVATEAEALGAPGSLCLRTDVSDAAAVKALADATYEKFGAAHVLCNNAGVLVDGPIHEATHSQWEWVLGVNLWGVIHGIEHFLPRMLAGGQEGHIVNTASMAGMAPITNSSVYCTSKYAVVGLTETLWRDLRDTPLGVSVLCPMWVRTEIFRSGGKKPTYVDKAKAEVDMSAIDEKDWKTPEQVSPLVLDAIEHEKLYIFTHPGITESYIERRIERIQAHYPGR